MHTGFVSAVNEDTGLIQVTLHQNGRVLNDVNPMSMGDSTGLFYMPSYGEIVILDTQDSFLAFITSTVSNLSPLTKNTLPSLHTGELILQGKYGQILKFNNFGDIILQPGPKGEILLGSPSPNQTDGVPFTGKRVVRDGDTVTGTDSHGDTVTGTVHASTVKVYAG